MAFCALRSSGNDAVGVLRVETPRSLRQDIADRQRRRARDSRRCRCRRRCLSWPVARLRDQKILGRSFALRSAHALAAMQAARHAGDFGVGMPEHGIVIARIHRDAVGHLLHFFRCSLVNAPGFHIRRLACQGCTHCNCSGNRLGSAAAENASLPRIAETWCWPWPSRGVPVNRRMITSGRKRRITQTTSLRIFSRPHFCKRFFGSFGEAEIDGAGEKLLVRRRSCERRAVPGCGSRPARRLARRRSGSGRLRRA